MSNKVKTEAPDYSSTLASTKASTPSPRLSPRRPASPLPPRSLEPFRIPWLRVPSKEMERLLLARPDDELPNVDIAYLIDLLLRPYEDKGCSNPRVPLSCFPNVSQKAFEALVAAFPDRHVKPGWSVSSVVETLQEARKTVKQRLLAGGLTLEALGGELCPVLETLLGSAPGFGAMTAMYDIKDSTKTY